MGEKKSNPISFRLTDEAIEALKECEEKSGLKRSGVAEVAFRRYRDELRQQDGPKGGARPRGRER